MDVSALAGILAERLLSYAPWLQKAFFANSGTEAVEAAIKFARAATGRPGIIHCANSFHGLTYGSLSAVGDEIYRQNSVLWSPAMSRSPSTILPRSSAR